MPWLEEQDDLLHRISEEQINFYKNIHFHEAENLVQWESSANIHKALDANPRAIHTKRKRKTLYNPLSLKTQCCCWRQYSILLLLSEYVGDNEATPPGISSRLSFSGCWSYQDMKQILFVNTHLKTFNHVFKMQSEDLKICYLSLSVLWFLDSGTIFTCGGRAWLQCTSLVAVEPGFNALFPDSAPSPGHGNLKRKPRPVRWLNG